MREHRRKIDKENVEMASYLGKKYVEATIELARAFLSDWDKAKRRNAGLCPLCYYESSRIGAAAITTAQCGLCDEQLLSGNTNIDVLCQSCALQTGLCKHCGADVNLVNRRKRELPKPTPTKECDE